MVKITLRDVGEIVIINVVGEITLGSGDTELHQCILDLSNKGKTKLILNLSSVSFIDSSGVGEIVRGLTTAKKHGGILKLLGLQKKVRDIFTITRLITVFDSFDTEQEALNSFK
jgi:anti-sigma B factor antagonist